MPAGAKEKLYEICMSPRRADAERAFDQFAEIFEASSPFYSVADQGIYYLLARCEVVFDQFDKTHAPGFG